jgi:hypothetical protein
MCPEMQWEPHALKRLGSLAYGNSGKVIMDYDVSATFKITSQHEHGLSRHFGDTDDLNLERRKDWPASKLKVTSRLTLEQFGRILC